MRNFIMSIVPFVLAFEDACANRQLVRFECQFNQLSKRVSGFGVSRKTNQGVRTRQSFTCLIEKEIRLGNNAIYQ